ncbi:MAG: RNA polymerase sigma factor [Pseudomonadota bacterium]
MSRSTRRKAPSEDEHKRLIERTYRSYISELIAGIRRHFGAGPPDPEDVAHEAFRRAYERENLETVANLKGLLWRISRNLIIDAKRSARSRSKYDFEVEQIFFPLRGFHSTPENVNLARDQLAELNALLREMPEQRRWALLARRLEHLSLKEIGAHLGISRTAVAKHISKAEQQINEHFLDGEDG